MKNLKITTIFISLLFTSLIFSQEIEISDTNVKGLKVQRIQISDDELMVIDKPIIKVRISTSRESLIFDKKQIKQLVDSIAIQATNIYNPLDYKIYADLLSNSATKTLSYGRLLSSQVEAALKTVDIPQHQIMSEDFVDSRPVVFNKGEKWFLNNYVELRLRVILIVKENSTFKQKEEAFDNFNAIYLSPNIDEEQSDVSNYFDHDFDNSGTPWCLVNTRSLKFRFDTNSAVLSSVGKKQITNAATELESYMDHNHRWVILGRTDTDGNSELNQRTSVRRAKRVVQFINYLYHQSNLGYKQSENIYYPYNNMFYTGIGEAYANIKKPLSVEEKQSHRSVDLFIYSKNCVKNQD